MTVTLTPTEQRIINLLSDGWPHSRAEMMGLLGDDLTSTNTLAAHLFRLRRKIRPHGDDVVTEVPNGISIHYRLVRLVGSAYNGYR